MPPAPRVSAADRFVAALGALACLAVLVIAARLAPSADGHGTHEQLGMPRCSWVIAFDKPCPTCGMTTSFAHAAEGDLLASARVQPAGMLLAVGAAGAFWVLGHTAVFGSRAARLFRPMWTTRWIAGGAAVLLLAWGYKFLTWGAQAGTLPA